MKEVGAALCCHCRLSPGELQAVPGAWDCVGHHTQYSRPRQRVLILGRFMLCLGCKSRPTTGLATEWVVA